MNFDYIEGLTEEQVKELYDDVIERDKLLLGTSTIWKVSCNEGTIGYFAQTNNKCPYIGLSIYRPYGDGGAVDEVCGQGKAGIATCVTYFDETKSGTAWSVRCNSGIEGVFAEDGNRCPYIGITFYRPYGDGGAVDEVCGSGRGGTAVCVSYY